MNSPFERRIAKRGIGHNGRQSEVKQAKRLSAALRPASGAMDSAKGDMTMGQFLLEAKATQSESMSLKKDWLLKIYQEALEVNKSPALTVTFTDQAGKSEKRERWVMMPEHIFSQLVDGFDQQG